MRAFVFRWHRKLATLAGICTLLWVFSGLLHPFMTYWGPRPVAFMPPGEEFFVPPDVMGFSKVAKTVAGQRFSAFRLVKANYRWAWQGRTENGFVYYDTATGAELPQFGEAYAAHLARHYAGIGSEISVVALQTRFDATHPPINRLLPVYKVSLADGRVLYVDPNSDRLGGITDPVRRGALKLFQTVHTLSFLDPVEGMRMLGVFFAVTLVLAIGMLGILLRASLRYRHHAQGTRRWHSLAAYLLWLPVLMFAGSGLFHLVVQSPLLKHDPAPKAQAFTLPATAQLPALKGVYTDLRIVTHQGRPVWRVVMGGSAKFYELKDQRIPIEEADWARSLAGTVDAGAPQKVLSFTNEYGFAAKRLPVWRFARGNDIVFVDPVDAVVSSVVTRSQVAEQWAFTTFHKWQFLDAVTGKRWRDAVIAVIALMVAGMAVTGLVLSRRRK